MAANNFSFLPKSMLVRIADMFQTRESDHAEEAKDAKVRQMPDSKEAETAPAKSLNSLTIAPNSVGNRYPTVSGKLMVEAPA